MLAKDGRDRELDALLYDLCEGLRWLAVLLHPFMPERAAQMWAQLGLREGIADDWLRALHWGGLEPGTQTQSWRRAFPAYRTPGKRAGNMSERNAPSRAITVGGGIVAIAGLAVALTLYARVFTQVDWALTLAAAAAIAFVAANALPVRGLRMRRTGLSAEAIFLDLPIAAPLFALGSNVGPTACALAFALGFGCASVVRNAAPVADLPRHGVLRILAALAVLPLGLNAAQMQTPVYAAVVFGAVVTFRIRDLGAGLGVYISHLALMRLWTRLGRDPRTWGIIAGGVIWATVARNEIVLGEYPLAMALWLPVCLCAFLLRHDRQATIRASPSASRTRRRSSDAR